MNIQTLTLCLVEKDHILCDKCGVSLNNRLFKNKRIALSTSKNSLYGFICVKCFLNPKSARTLQCTQEQLDEFVKSQCTKSKRGK